MLLSLYEPAGSQKWSIPDNNGDSGANVAVATTAESSSTFKPLDDLCYLARVLILPLMSWLISTPMVVFKKRIMSYIMECLFFCHPSFGSFLPFLSHPFPSFMIDHVNTTKSSHFHQPRPGRRLKKIFCPRHKVQDEHELAISPPIIDSVYSPLASPTNLKNHGPSPYHHHQQPLVLNSVPPRVSSMPKRTSTMPTPSKTISTSHHSSLPRPPRKSISRPRPLPNEQDRRHSFHLPPTNTSATSVRTAPPATTTTTTATGAGAPPSSRLADLGNKAKRQSRAAASVAVSGAPVPVMPVKSRSTPMRVKTYNVNYNPQAEMERVRKQKELEELIAGGRRGSTLKLSLTPRGL